MKYFFLFLFLLFSVFFNTLPVLAIPESNSALFLVESWDKVAGTFSGFGINASCSSNGIIYSASYDVNIQTVGKVLFSPGGSGCQGFWIIPLAADYDNDGDPNSSDPDIDNDGDPNSSDPDDYNSSVFSSSPPPPSPPPSSPPPSSPPPSSPPPSSPPPSSPPPSSPPNYCAPKESDLPIPSGKEWSWKLCKLIDLDTDEDGVPDNIDAFPADPLKWEADSNHSQCEAIYNDQKDKEKGFTLAVVSDTLISILPQTPQSMRIPTLIVAWVGGTDSSLAAQLALELYSAGWQIFAIVAFVGFYKLIPGKNS
jgi:hypothetical protein